MPNWRARSSPASAWRRFLTSSSSIHRSASRVTRNCEVPTISRPGNRSRKVGVDHRGEQEEGSVVAATSCGRRMRGRQHARRLHDRERGVAAEGVAPRQLDDEVERLAARSAGTGAPGSRPIGVSSGRISRSKQVGDVGALGRGAIGIWDSSAIPRSRSAGSTGRIQHPVVVRRPARARRPRYARTRRGPRAGTCPAAGSRSAAPREGPPPGSRRTRRGCCRRWRDSAAARAPAGRAARRARARDG